MTVTEAPVVEPLKVAPAVLDVKLQLWAGDVQPGMESLYTLVDPGQTFVFPVYMGHEGGAATAAAERERSVLPRFGSEPSCAPVELTPQLTIRMW